MFRLACLILSFTAAQATWANPLVTEGTCSRLVLDAQGHIETFTVKFNLRNRTLAVTEAQNAKAQIFPLTEIRSDSDQTQLVAAKDERSVTGILKKYVLTLSTDSASLVDATVKSAEFIPGATRDSATVTRHDLICLP